MYQIYLRDANLKRIGEITDFTKLELIPRFNNVGSFVLDLPTNCEAARELIKEKGGIILKKDGITIFSGTVTSKKRSFGSSGDRMIFAGKDDNLFLTRRLVYPVPSGDFSFSAYNVRTGAVETVMKQFVDHNAGINALPERRLLTIEPDKALGGIVTGRGRFQTLLELLQKLAVSSPEWGEIGFRVVQVGDALEFQVYHPQDRTKSVVFSPLLGNLSSFEYSHQYPDSNYVIVGGGGEGTERIIREKGDSSSISKYGRFESFVDQRYTSDETELSQSIDEELINKSQQNSLNFMPIDTPQLAFGRDYGLGDKVTIIITQPNEVVDQEAIYHYISTSEKIEMQPEVIRKIQEKLDVIQDIVRDVKISITPERETITPIVGTQDTNSKAIIGIFDKMKKITQRISNLERR